MLGAEFTVHATVLTQPAASRFTRWFTQGLFRLSRIYVVVTGAGGGEKPVSHEFKARVTGHGR